MVIIDIPISEFSILIALRNDFSLFLDQADASFTVLYETERITSKKQLSTYQCQLFTLTASGRSSTIHLGSPSPHLAIAGVGLPWMWWTSGLF